MWVSAAEPPALRALGEFNPLCEQWGADFLFLTKAGIIACQRKTQADLLASLRSSDRIARELPLLQNEAIATAILLIEGEPEQQSWGAPKWKRQRAFSRPEYRGIIMSVQRLGIWVIETFDLDDTADTLLQLQGFFDKGEHVSLLRRPKPRPTSTPERDRAIHAMQSAPGWGYKQCALVYDHLGYAPFTCTITEAELRQIKGIGPVRAKNFVTHFGGGNGQGTQATATGI